MRSLVPIGSEMWICIRYKHTNKQTFIFIYKMPGSFSVIRHTVRMIGIIVQHTMTNKKSVIKNLDLEGTEINIKSPAVTLCTNKFNIQ